jgi:hypothetical protein
MAPPCAVPVLTRYGGAVDVRRAADLYARGRTLRQIGAELGVHWSTVSEQLPSAGITMRRGAPRARHASTQQILDLRDQGLTWNEVAEQVDMTVCRRTRTPEPRTFFACGERWLARLPCPDCCLIHDFLGMYPPHPQPPNCLRAGHAFLHEAREDCNGIQPLITNRQGLDVTPELGSMTRIR